MYMRHNLGERLIKMIDSIKRRLKSKKGETLTETLASLLIIVPAMVMLAGAIVTAAHINSEARSSKASELPKFTATSGTSGAITGTGDVTFMGGNIKWCNEDDSIYFYFR